MLESIATQRYNRGRAEDNAQRQIQTGSRLPPDVFAQLRFTDIRPDSERDMQQVSSSGPSVTRLLLLYSAESKQIITND